jgi:hypothetical protein
LAVGNVGTVAGSITNDLQIELQNPEVLEEVASRKLPYDLESRLSHACFTAAIGGALDLALGVKFGCPVLGLVIGLIAGFIVGVLLPTDWGELSSIWFGSLDVSVMHTLG